MLRRHSVGVHAVLALVTLQVSMSGAALHARALAASRAFWDALQAARILNCATMQRSERYMLSVTDAQHPT